VKTAIGSANPPLIPLASLLSAPWPSRKVQAVIWKLFHLMDEAPTGAGARTDLHKRSVPHHAFSDELATSDIISYLMAAHCCPNMYSVA
jgi:hypothetical protein